MTVDENGTTTPVFDSVSDPATASPQEGLVAPDLTAVRLAGTIKGDQAVVDRRLVPVRPAIAAMESDGSGFVVHSVSQTLTNEDITKLINSSLDTTFITIGLTFVILLITFGAFAAAVVPIVLALSALIGAFGIFGLFSQAVNPVSPYASQLIILIGLAVSVDYSLFMITRFRSERRRGRDKLLAIEIAECDCGSRRVLQRARGDDLRGRPVHHRRVDLPVDGDRDDRRDLHLDHRQPDIPPGDAGDPGRSGQSRSDPVLRQVTR